MMLRLATSDSLYAHTARIFFVTLLLVQACTVAVSGYLLFLPVFRSSVNDLAALMVLSAKTYVELPPRTRPDFVNELHDRHRIDIQVTEGPAQGEPSLLPYVRQLEKALGDNLLQEVSVESSDTKPRYYWTDLYLAGEWLRVSFPRERIGTHPPLTLLLLLVLGTTITAVATLLVTRRLRAPLAALAVATRHVSHGALPPPLPESGPRELATLAHRFNRMAVRVRELLNTRTTLLAGISHDLRTPMSRIRLQIELMRGEAEQDRLDDIERDLEEMDNLIAQLLDIAREVSSNPVETRQLRPLVEEVVAGFERAGAAIRTNLQRDCVHSVNELAFKRVLYNLVDNAFKHGKPPVQVRMDCVATHICVEILDAGTTLAGTHDERLFEPFVRRSGSAGSGLGLAIVRGIAQTYGWTITLGHRESGGAARLTIPRSEPEPS